MKRNLFSLILFLTLSVPLGVCANSSGPQVGDIVPTGEVGVARDGTHVQVSDYAGKIVVLSFWASWCGPCRKELPTLEGLQQVADEKHLPLQVIAVNIEEREVFRKIAAKLGNMHLQLANDRNDRSSKVYGVKGIPHMVIIGKDGRIAQVHVGYGEKEIDRFVAEINKLLSAS